MTIFNPPTDREPSAAAPNRVRFFLPWPPSANRIWRVCGGRAVPYFSAQYKKYIADAQAFYRKQGSPKLDDAERVQVALFLYAPNRRRFDVDNRIKPTLDALTKIGFWRDDSVVRKITAVDRGLDSFGNGVVTVVVRPYEASDEL